MSVAVPTAYTGRVRGGRSGASSSGQATFTLNDINSNDQAIYMWMRVQICLSSCVPITVEGEKK